MDINFENMSNRINKKLINFLSNHKAILSLFLGILFGVAMYAGLYNYYLKEQKVYDFFSFIISFTLLTATLFLTFRVDERKIEDKDTYLYSIWLIIFGIVLFFTTNAEFYLYYRFNATYHSFYGYVYLIIEIFICLAYSRILINLILKALKLNKK